MAPPRVPGVILLPWNEWLLKLLQHHIDPYILWSIQTRFRQHVPPYRPLTDKGEGIREGQTNEKPEIDKTKLNLEALDFLIELDAPINAKTPVWPDGVKPPDIYCENLPGGGQSARHITVRMDVKEKTIEQIMSAVGELISVKGVKRTQMGFPRPRSGDDRAERVYAEPSPAHERTSEAVKPHARVVLGVLDDACPFGHPALVSNGKTRVAAFWDQSLSKEKPPAKLDYGRVRAGDELNCVLNRHKDGAGHDEEALYLDHDALQPRLRERSVHAAAVVTLLAGQRTLLPAHPTTADPPDTEVDTVDLGDKSDDDASCAPLVVVQFPREQVNLTARWMAVRALDGLRYIASEAQRLYPTLPLVANLSYGGVVGAHDGTAMLETAMDELARAHQRMAIVLAAGNSYGTRRNDGGDSDNALGRQPSGYHASGLLQPHGGTISLALCVAANKPIETYLEMWFEDVHKQHSDEHFLEKREVSIEAKSPVGQILKIDLPYVAFDNQNSGLTGAGLIGLTRVAQSQLRSMALLVVAATQISSTRVEVPSGIWEIRITNNGPRCLRLKAWVERDLLPGLARQSQAARLVPSLESDAAELLDDDTINNIATGSEVFRVGALNWRRPPPRKGVSVYSSAARDDSVGPEFSAVADESPLLPGIRVSGSISSMNVRMNGTSVAAPQAARYIANRLASGDDLIQIRNDIAHATGDRRLGRIRV